MKRRGCRAEARSGRQKELHWFALKMFHWPNEYKTDSVSCWFLFAVEKCWRLTGVTLLCYS